VLTAQRFPPPWTAVIVDADWMIVARDISPEKFVGKKAGGEEFRNARSDQTHEVRLVTGEAAMSAHTHSARFGWTTAIAMTEADLFKQAIGPVLLAAIGSFVATGVVIAMAALFAMYLGRAIAALAEMVRAFPEGTLSSKPGFRLHEMSVVAQIVHDAALAVLDGRKVVNKELNDSRHLNELSSALVGEGTSFQTCLDQIVNTAVAIAGADKGNIQLFDPASGSLTIAAQKGFQQDFLKFFGNVRDNASSSGLAMREKKQIIVDDVLTSDVVGQSAQKTALLAGVRGVVSTPLISSKAELLGMLSIHYARPGRPGERELRLLNILIRQASDYLERKQSEQTNKTILNELQHRSNNLLAVVQSLAHRSLQAGSPKEAFEARIQALARANRALLKSNWTGAYIDQLVRTELEAFSKRAAISGPSLLLPPQTAQNFTLALHELATNSTKYGSLSTSAGRLMVLWTVKSTPSGSVLHFRWLESDGPPVAAPVRQGFGTQLLNSVFRETRLDYAVDGLRCEIEVPLGGKTSETKPVPEAVNA
jgi:two-component sensor histidine kinase